MTDATDKPDETEQDTTVGQQQENPTGAVPGAAQTGGSGTGSGGGSGSGSGSGQGAVADPGPGIVLGDAPDVVGDETKPADEVLAMTQAQALAEALKPVAAATDELYASDPAKVAARKASGAAYVKATAKAAGTTAAGPLRAKYALADKKFQYAAQAMRGRLDAWIDKWLGDAARDSVKAILLAPQQINARFENRLGPREIRRDQSAVTARSWQKAYADWSKPADVMTALIGEYIDRIDALHNAVTDDKNADLAIYSFWFDIAPKHLQLSPDTVTDATAPGTAALAAKLGEPWARNWKSGKDRGDGSVFLLPAAEPNDLTKQRVAILTYWKQAATEQAKREADFKLRPDDAATLKARRDALGQASAAAIKTLLEDTAS